MKRSEQKVVLSIDVTPEAAWKVIGAVSGVDKWLAPVITTCRVEGDKRYCGTEGGEFEEDILEVNHEKRILRYAIPQQHMMPVENILGSMKVISGNDQKAIIEWHWTFDVEEENEAQAKEMLSGTGTMGIQGIEQYIKLAA